MANRIYPAALPNPVTPLGYDGTDFKALKLDADGALVTTAAAGPPLPHAASHQDGGTDEVNVGALSGLLADRQDAAMLQGTAVSAAPPGDGEVLEYDLATTQWQPKAPAAAGVGAWKVLVDTTLAAATQHWDFAELDLNTAVIFHIFMRLKNQSAQECQVLLYVNADYTDNHYSTETLHATGAAATAAYVATGRLLYLASAGGMLLDGKMGIDTAGYVRFVAQSSLLLAAAIASRTASWNKLAAAANVTSLRISSDRADGFAIGSRVIILGMA